MVGDQITSTDGTFQAYVEGLKWTPNMNGLIAKTLIPPQTVQLSFQGSPGVVRNSAGRNALGGIGCANVDYDPTSTGHFSFNIVRACYLNASGFGASPNGYAFSSGIAFNFFGVSK